MPKLKFSPRASLDSIKNIRRGSFSLKQIVLGIIILIVLVITGFAVAIYGFHKDTNATTVAARIFPFPAALVNRSPISLSEYNFTRTYTKHFYDASKLAYDEKTLNKQILDQLIDTKLVEQHAASAKVTVSSAEVDDAYQKLIDKSGKDEVTKVLTDFYGLSEKQFKTLIYDQVLKTKLETTLKDKGEWNQVKVRHLLIKVDQNADQKTVDGAKAKAQSNLDQIKAGASFDDLAKKNSEDVASKDQGGELGYISRGQTAKEFENAIFASTAKKGDLLGPIRTQFGWHIILIEEVRGTNDYPIWRTQASIKKFVAK